jgi:hypothetical protein
VAVSVTVVGPTGPPALGDVLNAVDAVAPMPLSWILAEDAGFLLVATREAVTS